MTEKLTLAEVFARATADEPPMPDLVPDVLASGGTLSTLTRSTRSARSRGSAGLGRRVVVAVGGLAAAAAVVGVVVVAAPRDPAPARPPDDPSATVEREVLGLLGAAFGPDVVPDDVLPPQVSISAGDLWVLDGVYADEAGRGDVRVALTRPRAAEEPTCTAVAAADCAPFTRDGVTGISYSLDEVTEGAAGSRRTVVVVAASGTGYVVDLRLGMAGRAAFPDGPDDSARPEPERPAPLVEGSAAVDLAVSVAGLPALGDGFLDSVD